MGTAGNWIEHHRGITGKWQIPVLALSIGLLAAAAYRHRQQSTQAKLLEGIRQQEFLMDAGRFDQAAHVLFELLKTLPPRSPERAGLQLALARAEFGHAELDSAADVSTAQEIIGRFEQAVESGARLESEDIARVARVHEWAGRIEDALRNYQEAIDQGAADSGRLRRRMTELLRSEFEAPVKRCEPILDAVLAEGGRSSPQDRIWALGQKVSLLDGDERTDEAGHLLERHAGEFAGTDLERTHSFLKARHLFQLGLLDEAELFLRSLRAELKPWDEEHGKTGWLLGRVLLSRSGMTDAEEAASFFNDVILHHPGGTYSVGSRVGLGDALMALGRDDEARDAYAEAVEQLPKNADPDVVDRDVVRVRLALAAEEQRNAGNLRRALDFSRLALRLISPRRRELLAVALRDVAEFQWRLADQLRIRGGEVDPGTKGAQPPSYEEIQALYNGAARDFLQISEWTEGSARSGGDRWEAARLARDAAALHERSELEESADMLRQVADSQAQFARQLEELGSDPRTGIDKTPDEVRAMYRDAARLFARLAEISIWDESRSSEAAYRAAELWANAGDLDQAIEHYQRFVVERPSDAKLPRALLAVGQLLEKQGRTSDAANAYRECHERFPQSLEGVRALLPLARTYVAMGRESAEPAEAVLRMILEESDVFTPQAPEFVEALFLSGEVQNGRGSPERAVEVLEEAIERAPAHPRSWDARYLLADAYRQSAMRIKSQLNEMKISPAREWLRRELPERLRRARELYHAYAQELASRDPRSLNPRESLGLRLAPLYEADCCYESQDYRAALQRYDAIAHSKKGTQAALAAYVQVINCRVFLGEFHEAGEAHRHVQVMLGEMSAEELGTGPDARSLDEWRRYFRWLGESGLF